MDTFECMDCGYWGDQDDFLDWQDVNVEEGQYRSDLELRCPGCGSDAVMAD